MGAIAYDRDKYMARLRAQKSQADAFVEPSLSKDSAAV